MVANTLKGCEIMNEMQIFNNVEFGRVRKIVDENGVHWIMGKDVCNAVGDKNSQRSLSKIKDADKRIFEITDSMGRKQNAVFVNEYGFYDLVFAMQPQKANKDGMSDAYPIETQRRIEKIEKFKEWVTHEVLPSIRETGGYITGKNILEVLTKNPRNLAALLNQYADTMEQKAALEAEIEANKPKVEFADALLVCENCIYIEELAKLLCQIGMNTGRNRLFEEMASDGFLCIRNGVKNMPTQKCVENGWLVIEKKVFERGGKTIMGYTTKVTPKGIQYFIGYYKRKHGLEPVLTTSRRRVIEQRQAPRQLRAAHNQTDMR